MKRTRKKTGKLANVLWMDHEFEIDLERWNVTEVKRVASFWVGNASKLRKDEALRAVRRAMKSPQPDLAQMLKPDQRETLRVVALYGGSMPGNVLSAEMHARGLVPPKHKDHWRNPVPTESLTRVLALHAQRTDYGSKAVPGVTLARGLRNQVDPTEPLVLAADQVSLPKKVNTDGSRSSAEVLLDLLGVHEFLCSAGDWKPLRGGDLPKGMINRMAKRFGKLPDEREEKLELPDADAFCYQILIGLGLVQFHPNGRASALADTSALAGMSGEEFLWHCVRAWLGMRLWQDGLGAVKESYNDWEPERIEFDGIAGTRAILSWQLSRLAHGDLGWVELESFLLDLFSASKEQPPRMYFYGFDWSPKFPSAARREDKTGTKREVAYWMSSEGVWFANAIMVTLHALGLVERGKAGPKHCFRLTDDGRRVFGAPSLQIERPAETKPFAVVQANFDVVLYLDEADAEGLLALLPFLKRLSASAGAVQTFRLERERVYLALEGGLSIDEIRARLKNYSREALPAIVDRALSEWSGKHESLVLRKNICLTIGGGGVARSLPKQREISEGCLIAPRSAAGRLKTALSKTLHVNHGGAMPPAWELSESGEVRLVADPPDLVAGLRLRAVGKKSRGAWRISADSVRAAALSGIPPDQVIAWLGDHCVGGVPDLLATAITNWASGARKKKCFAGKLQAVQLANPAFEAVCASRAFAGLVAGTIAPDWIIFEEGKATAASKLLESFGFALGGEMKIDPPTSSLVAEEPPKALSTPAATTKKKSAKKKQSKRKPPTKMSEATKQKMLKARKAFLENKAKRENK